MMIETVDFEFGGYDFFILDLARVSLKSFHRASSPQEMAQALTPEGIQPSADVKVVAGALLYAATAHASIDQRRKYTFEPYVVHPVAVAKIVKRVGGNPQMIAAALLHDVVEDTPVTIGDIKTHFGEEVAELVYWLTDVSTPEDGNRAVRKQLDLEHIAKAPPAAKTIKLADLIDNTLTIQKHDPDFWRVYRHEKLRLLEVLTEGDAALWARAREQCE